MRIRVTLTWFAAVCCVTGFAGRPVVAQGIESYAVSHLFALGGATPNREFGMGGIIASVPDYGSGNPAFAALHQRPNVSLRAVMTDFDSGLELRGYQGHLVYPLKPNYRGIQITWYDISSDPGAVMLPGMGQGTISLDHSEGGFHYGQRLGPHWIAGVGLAPKSDITLDISVPGGSSVLHVQSESDLGARWGLGYEAGPDEFFGAIYDNYTEDVTATGLSLGGQVVTGSYRTEMLAVGASRRFGANYLGALEWQWSRVKGGGAEVSVRGWHFGMEANVATDWRLRAGMSDGHLTMGAGYDDGRWAADYAFVNNWNSDAVRALLGSSDTHMVSTTYNW